jgi:hypothetical protein
MMTLDEALQLYAQKMDRAFAENVEQNFARMVEDGLSDAEIAMFQKFEADNYPTIRDEALAQVRERLMRDGGGLH